MLKLFKKNDNPKPSEPLKAGLTKTRKQLFHPLRHLFQNRELDSTLLTQLETQLLTADVGTITTNEIIEKIKQYNTTTQQPPEQILKNVLIQVLSPIEQPLNIDEQKPPFVILVVGVNGVGKTTTIGKLANYFKSNGKSVMLAAGDTFRAAAIEQLQIWGERNDVPVIAQQRGSDSAAVIFDALQSATAKHVDVLIADTAGRLHTQTDFMETLKKIKRVMNKLDDSAPHEVLLVLDATLGQNTLAQAKTFSEMIAVSGIVLTKLDGTAKGGILFTLAKELGIPIRFIGVGEAIDDLMPFKARDFVDALLEDDGG